MYEASDWLPSAAVVRVAWLASMSVTISASFASSSTIAAPVAVNSSSEETTPVPGTSIDTSNRMNISKADSPASSGQAS